MVHFQKTILPFSNIIILIEKCFAYIILDMLGLICKLKTKTIPTYNCIITGWKGTEHCLNELFFTVTWLYSFPPVSWAVTFYQTQVKFGSADDELTAIDDVSSVYISPSSAAVTSGGVAKQIFGIDGSVKRILDVISVMQLGFRSVGCSFNFSFLLWNCWVKGTGYE